MIQRYMVDLIGREIFTAPTGDFVMFADAEADKAEAVDLMAAERDQAEIDWPMHVAHVIVEFGIVPGLDGTCRCEMCRAVAKKMVEAGYLDCIRDRWWEEPIEPQDSGNSE